MERRSGQSREVDVVAPEGLSQGGGAGREQCSMEETYQVSRLGGLVDCKVGSGYWWCRRLRQFQVPELVGMPGSSEDGGIILGDGHCSCCESGLASSITKLAYGDEGQIAKGRKQVSSASIGWEAREMDGGFMGGVHDIIVGHGDSQWGS